VGGGHVGAFFSSIARAMPVNVNGLSHIRVGRTSGSAASVFLHVVVAELLFGFVGRSGSPVIQTERKDIWYDVLQSFGAFLAAYFLGFLKLDTSYGGSSS